GLQQPGKTPLLQMVVLDDMLEPVPLVADNQYLILRADTLAETSAPPFHVGLNGSSLVAESGINSLLQNYVAGTGWTIPYVAGANATPVTVNSFVVDYVTPQLAGNIFTALSTVPNQFIDPANGQVAASFTTVPPAALTPLVGGSIGVARWVREVLLAAYF